MLCNTGRRCGGRSSSADARRMDDGARRFPLRRAAEALNQGDRAIHRDANCTTDLDRLDLLFFDQLVDGRSADAEAAASIFDGFEQLIARIRAMRVSSHSYLR